MKLRLLLTVGAMVSAFLTTNVLAAPPEDITFSGAAESPISATVAVPAGRALFLTSGTVPPSPTKRPPPATLRATVTPRPKASVYYDRSKRG